MDPKNNETDNDTNTKHKKMKVLILKSTKTEGTYSKDKTNEGLDPKTNNKIKAQIIKTKQMKV